MKAVPKNLNIPEVIYTHISIEQANRDFRLNTLIPFYFDFLNRTTNLFTKNEYTSIDNIILKLNSTLVKNNYYLEIYNKNIFLVSKPIQELNKFLLEIKVEEQIVLNSEVYEFIKKYSDLTGIPISLFKWR